MFGLVTSGNIGCPPPLRRALKTGEKQQQLIKGKHEKAVYHLVSAPTTMRYTKVFFWDMAPISTGTGQLRREPLFGARHPNLAFQLSLHRFLACPYRSLARKKRGGKQLFLRPLRPTERPSILRPCTTSERPTPHNLQIDPNLRVRVSPPPLVLCGAVGHDRRFF